MSRGDNVLVYGGLQQLITKADAAATRDTTMAANIATIANVGAALQTGAATAAKQDTIIAALATLHDDLRNILTALAPVKTNGANTGLIATLT